MMSGHFKIFMRLIASESKNVCAVVISKFPHTVIQFLRLITVINKSTFLTELMTLFIIFTVKASDAKMFPF